MKPPFVRVADWAVISPVGSGKSEFTHALHGRTAGRRRLGATARGGIDRLSVLAMETVDQLLGPADLNSEADRPTAIVLGTSTGSVPRLVEMAHESYTGRRGHDIRPLSIPSMVPNTAAGRLAIHRRISGPNVTVAAGPISGLQALTVAARLIRLGHAEHALAGAIEELSYPRALTDRSMRSAAERAASPLAEACALLKLELTDRPIGTVLLGARYAHSSGGSAQQRELLVGLIRALLDANVLHPGDIDQVQLSRPESAPWGDVERDAVRTALGGHAAAEFAVAEVTGDTHSATGALQVTAALSMGGRYRLITSVGPNGEVAAMLLSQAAEAAA